MGNDVPDIFMGDDDIPIPARPKPKAPPPVDLPSRAAVEQSAEDDQNTIQWLKDVGTGPNVKIKLYRISPKVWDGHQIGGHLTEFDAPFDEDEIRNRFGGGKFQVRVGKLTPRGNWQYAGARTIELAGDPKVTEELRDSRKDDAPPVIEDTTMQAKAMDTMERIAVDAAARARQLEDEARQDARGKSAFDPTLMELLLNPLRDRINAAEREAAEYRRAVAEKDQRILDLANKKPETTIQDTLLGKMFDSESTRIEAIRTQHESERRQLIGQHETALASSRDYFRQEMLMKEEGHKRELQSMRDNQEARVESLKSGYEGRLDVLKGRIADLERQVGKAETEIAELRAKKEKSMFEQMEDLARVKSAFENHFGSNEPEEKGSAFERVIGGIVESPLAQSIAARIQNAPMQQQPMPQQRPMTPREVRMRQAMQQQQAPQQVQHVPTPGAPVQVQQAPKKKLPTFDPLEVKAAQSFIENAIRSNVPPEDFARSAASMLPTSLIEAIQNEGIEPFLARVVKPEAGSPLLTMQGRNFLKKALRIIATGISEPEVATVNPES